MHRGSTQGLSEMALIAHLLDNLRLGEAREDGCLRLERVLYNTSPRTRAGTDVIALAQYERGSWRYVWQLRTKHLRSAVHLTRITGTLARIGFDPVRAQSCTALCDPIVQHVPTFMSLEVEGV